MKAIKERIDRLENILKPHPKNDPSVIYIRNFVDFYQYVAILRKKMKGIGTRDDRKVVWEPAFYEIFGRRVESGGWRKSGYSEKGGRAHE